MKNINLVLALAMLISLSIIGNISAQVSNAYSCPMGGVMYGFNGSYGYGYMAFSWIISILLIALIIAGIYWFLKSANKNPGGKR